MDQRLNLEVRHVLMQVLQKNIRLQKLIVSYLISRIQTTSMECHEYHNGLIF